MPIYIRTLGYKIYIWSNDFENARWGKCVLRTDFEIFWKKTDLLCVRKRICSVCAVL